MKIVLSLVALIVLLTLWLERRQPVVDSHTVNQATFWIQSIDKSLARYHAYSAVDQGNQQQVRLRCFGACPPMRVGQLWNLSYKINPPVSKRCLHFLCRHPYWFDKRLTIVQSKQATQVGEQALGLWQRQHEQYLQLLSMWFEEPSTVAVFSALTLNDKRFFDRHIWQVFKSTGTTHLVAMSGLHIGLLIALIGRLVLSAVVLLLPRFSDRHIHQLRLGLVVLIAVLLFLLVNPSSSIERALLMAVGAAVAIGFRRHLSLKKSWVLAAVVLLLLDPGIVFSVGAWLSFLTVWVLIRYSKPMTQYESLWVASISRCGLVFVFLLPVSLYFFHSVSAWTPLVNLLAVPWFSLTVIPLLVLSVFSSFVSVTLAKGLAWLAYVFFQPMWTLLGQIAQWPGAQLVVGDFPLWASLVSLVVLVCCVDRVVGCER